MQEDYWQDWADVAPAYDLLKEGYFQTTVFPRGFWDTEYWQHYGYVAPVSDAVGGGGGAGPWANVAKQLERARQEDEDLIRLLIEIIKII